MSSEQPFYWTKPFDGIPWRDVAQSGWYQWTKDGLKYLGESILDRADESGGSHD